MKRLLIGLLAVLAWSGAGAQQQANTYATALPLTAQTATATSADQYNNSYRGAHVIINVTAYGAGTFIPTIQAKEPLSGTYYNLLVGPSISTTSTTIMKIYPGLAAVTSAAISDMLPAIWRVQVGASGSPSATYSVTYFLGN